MRSTKYLDREKELHYIPSMFTSAAVILLAGRKAAWLTHAVAGGGFY